MLWTERVQTAYDSWHRSWHLPGRFRMDRVLKDAGVHQLLVERDEFRAELEQAREALHLELLEIDHMLHLFGDPEFEPLRSIVVTLRALRAELTKEDERG